MGGDTAGGIEVYKRSGMGVKRATSNWGMNNVWNGGRQDGQRSGNGNGNGNGVGMLEAANDGNDDGYESAEEEMGGNGKGKVFTRGADGVCT